MVTATLLAGAARELAPGPAGAVLPGAGVPVAVRWAAPPEAAVPPVATVPQPATASAVAVIAAPAITWSFVRPAGPTPFRLLRI